MQDWHRKVEERKWLEFFNDPGQWWDNRSFSLRKNYPHFKHIRTGRGLWTSSLSCPEWVQHKLKLLSEPGSSATAQYKAEKARKPSVYSLVGALKDCGRCRELERGRELHAQAGHLRFVSNIHVSTSLITMYAKCGSMVDARNVFDGLPLDNVVAWNCLLQGYVDNGEPERALELFRCMQGTCAPDARTYVAVLSACCSLAGGVPGKTRRWSEEGKALHVRIVNSGLASDAFIGTGLINLYAKCRSMADAQAAFEKIERPDTVAWTALVMGYVENNECLVALETFEKAEQVCVPDAGVYVAGLLACASLAAGCVEGESFTKWLEKGRALHASAARNRCCDVFVKSKLVDFYAKCSSMVDAREVFDSMSQRTVVTWNALALGYVENGESQRALELISVMDTRSSLTFVVALRACVNVSAAERGRAFHEEIIARGLEQDERVASCLLDFYAKCGRMDLAWLVSEATSLKDVAFWNSLLCGYSRQGETEQVLALFNKMNEEDVQPSEVTFVTVITACSHAGLPNKGREVFSAMQSRHGVAPTLEHYCCMVDLLCRANYLEEALNVVETMPFKPHAGIWRTVLGACRKWNNVVVGKLAYESLMKVNEGYAPAYVMMASICQARG